MDISIIPALAGLTGAAIGGLTSGITSWFAQKTPSRVQLLAQDKVVREELYKEFIEAATRCYTAPTRKTGLSCISKPLRKDRQNARAVNTESPRQRRANRTENHQYVSGAKQDVFELREMINKNAIDILDKFGEACREEFRSLHMRTV